MLRIAPLEPATPGGNVARLQLVGRLSSRWVAELDRVCFEALSEHDAVELDMREVTFVDADGLQLLRRLQTQPVTLVNCALFVAEQLKAFAQDARP